MCVGGGGGGGGGGIKIEASRTTEQQKGFCLKDWCWSGGGGAGPEGAGFV